MKKIQVLGSGCSKCKKLAEVVELAVKQAAIECEVVKITDINEIINFGVMMTPALAIDGVVVSSGKVMSVEEMVVVLKKEFGGSSVL